MPYKYRFGGVAYDKLTGNPITVTNEQLKTFQEMPPENWQKLEESHVYDQDMREIDLRNTQIDVNHNRVAKGRGITHIVDENMRLFIVADLDDDDTIKRVQSGQLRYMSVDLRLYKKYDVDRMRLKELPWISLVESPFYGMGNSIWIKGGQPPGIIVSGFMNPPENKGKF